MTGNHRCGWKRLLLALLAVVLLTGASAACAAGFSDSPDDIEQAALSVLMLRIYDKDGNETATGSGFVMFDNQTLVTNYHVIDDAYSIVADSDEGYHYDMTHVLIADEPNDIAILRFRAPTNMQPLPYCADPVKRGSSVVAIGSPIGLRNTVSTGNVSSVYKEDGVNWIQFTAPISPGSSGGALFNDNGEVIGITSATYKRGQNLNLAVHMSDVLALYARWDGHTAYAVEEYSIELEESRSASQETPAPGGGTLPALTQILRMDEARLVVKLPAGYVVTDGEDGEKEIWSDDEMFVITIYVDEAAGKKNYRDMNADELDEAQTAIIFDWLEEDGLEYRSGKKFRVGTELFLRTGYYYYDSGDDPVDMYMIDYTTVRREQEIALYSLAAADMADGYAQIFDAIMKNISFY